MLKKYFWPELWIFLSLIFSAHASKSENTLNILVSGETHAMLMPCDCPVSPGGGLAKRGHIVSALRDSSTLLLVDAGGFSGGGMYDSYTEGRVMDSIRTLTTLRAMGEMGYDAAAIGDDDLQYGAAWLSRAASQAKVPLVSANCFYARGGLVAAPYVLVKKGKWTFAIAGMTTQEKFGPGSDEYSVAEPLKALRGIWDEMRKKSDYRIVLSHLGEEASMQILDSFPDCQAVINGHRKASTEAAVTANNRILMQFGFSGKSLSHAVVKPGKGALSVMSTEWIDISALLPDDPAIAAIVANPSSVQASGSPRQSAVLDLYIMSLCPYGIKALKGFVEATAAFPTVDRHIWFIGSETPEGALSSLHGNKEVEDEKLWLAVQALYPAKYTAFLADRASSNIPSDSAVKRLGIDVGSLRQWINAKGAMELRSQYLRSQRLGITASPTLLVNNESVDMEVTKARLGKLLCARLPKISAYCDSVPECIDNTDCKKQGMVGVCAHDKNTARCVYKDAVKFTFTALLPDSMLSTPQREILATTKELFTGATIDTVSVSSVRGKEMLARFSPRALPLYLFDKQVAQAENFDKIETGVELRGDYYWFKEGFVKKAYFHNRPVQPGAVEVFIDPVFAGAKDALKIAIRKRFGPAPRIFPLLTMTPEMDSLSHEDRANREEAKRWTVLLEKYPAQYTTYLNAFMKRKDESYWFLDLKDLGIGVDAFVKDIKNNSGSLLQLWRKQTELCISGPVELFINNREVVRVKSPKELGEILDRAVNNYRK